MYTFSDVLQNVVVVAQVEAPMIVLVVPEDAKTCIELYIISSFLLTASTSYTRKSKEQHSRQENNTRE